MTTKVITGFLSRPFGILILSSGLSALITLIYSFKKYNGRQDKCKTVKRQTGSLHRKEPNLDDPDWIETGRVKELYYYPLKSGRGKAISECDFTDFGISVKEDDLVTLKDRMFLVYSGKSGKFQTGRQHSKMVLVNISPFDESSVLLQAEGMTNLVFALPGNQDENSQVECSMWWGEQLKCVDCGPQPAAWISKFLTGSEDSDFRIGSAVSNRRNILKGPWEKFAKVYKTLRNEDTGYFADLASYMIMNESSLEQLNGRLERTVSSLQFRPNIVISGCEPFAEDTWEWIKIGGCVILRNVKPCPRCSMVLVDPETGKADRLEPLKTLRSFREQSDPERVDVDGKAPTLGIYCGLYEAGAVKIGDPVYVLSSVNNYINP